MKIEILGCSGSVLPGYNTTSTLVNDTLLIDAGSAASYLSYDRLEAISDILLTHSHLDHIKELPFILDPVFAGKNDGLRVWGSAVTIAMLKDHVFNGHIWPEMEEMKIDEDRLSFAPVPAGTFGLQDLLVQVVPVNHIPGAVGYLLTEGETNVLFSGDTGLHEELVLFASARGERLKTLFLDCSFPDRKEELARVSGHLTPSLIRTHILPRLNPATRVIACHIKPQYVDEVVHDLGDLEHVRGGEVFEL